MNPIVRSGLAMYGLALLAIGVIHFAFGHTPIGLMPIPDTVPGHRVLMSLDGIMLIVTGACLAAAYRVRWAAMGAAGLWFVLYLFLGLPKEIMHPFDPGSWTGAFELICLCGGALICGGAIAYSGPDAARKDQWMDIPFAWGKYLLAAGLVVFGVQHFLYADYVAVLITAWIPFKLFWTYFVGVAFCATALGLVLNLLVRLASLLMAAMFIGWLLVLHGPLVVGQIHVEPQWTSFFIAMAMAGLFLVLGGRRSLVVD